MATNFLKSNLVVTTGFLNTVNDAQPGASVASITGEQRYSGFLGGVIALDSQDVKFDPSIGTLYGGIYMYVQTAPSETNVPARGKAAFIMAPTATYPESGYFVSGDPQPAANNAQFVLGVFLSSITPGNCGFVQIAGRASCLFAGSLTSTTVGAAVGVQNSGSPTGTFDNGSTISEDGWVRDLGYSEVAPAINTISVVRLFGRFPMI